MPVTEEWWRRGVAPARAADAPVIGELRRIATDLLVAIDLFALLVALLRLH
jgi:hypothetical protein